MYPYKIQDLGILPGGTYTEPSAINFKGEIVGRAADSLNRFRVFTWTAKTGLVTLPMFPGNLSSAATNINDRSEIVGFCDGIATRWKGGFASDISQGVQWAPQSINNAGKIAGSKFDVSTHQTFACTLENGILNLLQLAKYQGSDQNVQCQGLCVISNGEVYGHILKSLTSSIFPYESALKWDNAGNVFELDFPDNQDAADGTRGRDSNVHSANDSGIVVGGVFDFSILYPFFWNAAGSKGALGLLPGAANGDAYDINSSNQVVGWNEYLTSAGRKEVATVWNGPIVTDLNTLIDPSLGWNLTQARCINASGQIEGLGYINGEFRGWVMTPVFRKIKIPPMFWHIVFGVVTDGPGIVIGPGGGVGPVPPWTGLIKNLPEPYRALLKELLQNQVVSISKNKKRK
jgi:uncharacterized membrane protein